MNLTLPTLNCAQVLLIVLTVGVNFEFSQPKKLLQKTVPGVICKSDYSAEAYCRFAIAETYKGNYKAAMKVYTDALVKHPGNGLIYQSRAWSEGWSGYGASAIGDYERAIKTGYNVAENYFRMGVLQHNSENLSAAVADFSQAVKFDPQNGEYRINYGIALLDKGESDASMEQFSILIKMKPDDPYCYADRGRARWRQGDLKGALEDYKKAVKLNPTNYLHIDACSELRWLLGDKNGALEDAELSLRAEPGFSRDLVHKQQN